MGTTFRVAVSASLFLLAVAPSFAVQPRGMSNPSSNIVSTTSIVERGGTITAIDSAKREIVVDGVSYELPTTIKIFPPPGSNQKKPFQLSAGMMIRFATEKNHSSGRNVVREVWVVPANSK